jgi:membrane protein DedA with SNARE-associated domain/rhodanese-related sulfurtransferase
MNEFLQFLVEHGAIVMFVALFIEQVGLPFPATPFLLFAGALVGTGKLNGFMVLGAAVLGSMVADVIWFYIGTLAGKRAVKILCRISLEPDSCVRRTQEVLAKYGMPGLIGAKFIPGLSTLLPPLAGSSGLRLSRFLFFDTISSLLYCSTFVFLGLLFSDQVEQIIAALASLGRGALVAAIILVAGYVAYKYWQRRRLLSELRMARITVDELRRQQETGENPFILDLRPASEVQQDPYLIPGAVHINIDEMEKHQDAIPRDREVILYCSCPNEVGSAKIALLLQRNGLTRVRPLLGGLDAWRERNYPLEARRKDLSTSVLV